MNACAPAHTHTHRSQGLGLGVPLGDAQVQDRRKRVLDVLNHLGLVPAMQHTHTHHHNIVKSSGTHTHV